MILQINTHSFVDLITNSSSELFVCDTEKTLEMVQVLIEKIIVNYYDELGETCPPIWDSIFNKPQLCEEDFNINSYPDKQELYEAKQDYWNTSAIREAKYKIEELNPYPQELNKLEWNERYKTELYQKWSKKDRQLRKKYLQPLYDEHEKKVEKVLNYFKNQGIEDPQTLFDYGITTKSGNILLYSSSDNSVPWECVTRIENVLNATRYHLG